MIRAGNNRLAIVLVSITVACLTAFICLVCSINLSVKSLKLPMDDAGLQIYDGNNKLVSTIYADRDTLPLPLSRIANYMQEAIITSEDRDFYHHHGVNPVSILRALWINLTRGHAVQGGSTITQQLVKNLFFPSEKRSLYGKAKEAILALEVETLYSKKKILESYLNYIYFGNGTFGVERAAEKYFGKTSATLSLAESAYLAGLVTAPSTLSTDAHHDEALARQKEILANMARLRYIPHDVAEKATQERLQFKNENTARESIWYYISCVLQAMEIQFGHDRIHAGGTKIFTNLDSRAQEIAARHLSFGIRHAPRGISQGAIVTLSVKDGSVVALVGGTGSYQLHPWNRALNPHTTGSAFKPFVYLAGLLSGVIRPDTIVDDSPVSIDIAGTDDTYAPKNFDNRFLGPMSVRRALALSRNVCAVRLAEQIGVPSIINTARLSGINSPLEPNQSIALGSCAASPFELACAYSTLARGGLRIEPVLVRRIEDSNGQALELSATNPETVFPEEPVAQLVDIMQDVVKEGTGKAAQLFDRPVAGKTGTADGGRDVWFVGFTPDTVTAVWAGNDLDRPVAGTQITGGAIAAEIWKNYMQAYYGLHPGPSGAFAHPVTPLLHDYQLQLPEAQLASNPADGTLSHKSRLDSPKSSHPGFVGKLFHKLFSIFH